MASFPRRPARPSALEAEMWRPGARPLPSSRTTPSSPAAAVARRIRARHSVLGSWSCRRHESATRRRPPSRVAPCSPYVTADRLRLTPPSALAGSAEARVPRHYASHNQKSHGPPSCVSSKTE
ncbi:hypothetical protein VPH35_104201 [Triticum aestivum]